MDKSKVEEYKDPYMELTYKFRNRRHRLKCTIGETTVRSRIRIKTLDDLDRAYDLICVEDIEKIEVVE